LRASNCDGVSRSRKIATNIAGIKLNRVNASIHVHPGVSGAGHSYVGIRATEHAAIAAFEQNTGRARHKGERVLVNVHDRTPAVTAGKIVK
jgi:hypothetical protein